MRTSSPKVTARKKRSRRRAAIDRRSAASTAAKQRRIQAAQDAKDRRSSSNRSTAAAQAGPRALPVELPRQHLEKPGRESGMMLKPQFMASHYLGSSKLRGKVALITGGDSGIGRAVAVLSAREGADVAIVYLNEHDDARTTQACVEREGSRCLLIPGDVRQAAFCKRAVARTVKTLGALDILVNNAAFQEHAKDIERLSEARFDFTL